MATDRKLRLLAIACALLWSCANASPVRADAWENLDRHMRSEVFQVNVAISVKLRDKQFAQLIGMSPAKHYPVFATTSDDKGFRVVGYGSCFPVRTNRREGTYFLTNKHVVDFGDGMVAEAQRFYAAMRLHAERTCALSSPDARYKELQRIVNLGLKDKMSGTERAVYQTTADSIWDTYDNHLSISADPTRQLFKKYSDATGFDGSVAFFIHGAGPSSSAPILGALYRKAQSDMEPDLAILYAKSVALPPLELDARPVQLGEVVQAVGYPAIKQSGVIVPPYYEPTFTTGKVKQTIASIVQFDAPVSKGDSGGPLINQQGLVVGVVVRRALTNPLFPTIKTDNNRLDDFAGAVASRAVLAFAPELFGSRSVVAPPSAAHKPTKPTKPTKKRR